MNVNLSNVTYSGNVNQATGATTISNSTTQNAGTNMGAATSNYSGNIHVPANLTPTQAGTALLASLSAGDSFTGEITNITMNQITIALSDTVQVSALLSNALSYNIGDIASFTIKDNSGSQIILQTNPNPNLNSFMNDQTITNALRNANIAINETTVSMVHEMMKQNVSIDSGTLNQYAKGLEHVSFATPEDVVLLTKMDIPVTNENVSGLHQYFNYSEGATSQAEKISTGILDTLQSFANDSLSEAGNFLSEIAHSFSEPVSVAEQMKAEFSADDRNNLSQLILNLDPNVEAKIQAKEDGTKPSVILHSNISELNRISEGIREGNYTSKDVLTDLAKLMQNNNLNPETAKEILGSKEMKSLVDSMLRQEMFLKPEDFSKENVKKLFAKTINDAEHIMDKLKDMPKAEGLSDHFSQIRNNVEFLNQVNHFMNFVQVPLKMIGQNAHGDLYVYKNKKALNSEDEMKVALHLDMEHLGSMDILVKLFKKNVSTDFKVETDEILSFIEAHMDELTKRLEALGYHVSSNVGLSEAKETYSFRKNVLEEELPSSEIKRFSFDVRA